MPAIHGKNGRLYVWDSAGASRLITDDMNSITLSWTRDNPTTTTFGQAGQSRVPGLYDATMSGAGLWSPSTNAGAASVLQEHITGSLNIYARWYPAGSVTGCPTYAACFLISQWETQGSNTAPVGFSFSMQLSSGSVTVGTSA